MIEALLMALVMGASFGPTAEAQGPFLDASELRSSAADSAAITAAEAWLPLLDAGDYDAAWERAGSFARANFPLADWRGAMASARERLGSLEVRCLAGVAWESSLPGAPPGEYVVLTYDSRFSEWAPAREQVTLMMEEDGSWGVLGYMVTGTD